MSESGFTMQQHTRSAFELSPLSMVEYALRAATLLLLLIVCVVPAHATEAFDDFVEKHYIIGGQPSVMYIRGW